MEKSKSDLLKETNRYKPFDDSTLRDVEAKTKVTPFLYRAVFTAALSVISTVMLILEKDYNLTQTEQTSIVGGGAIGALGAGDLENARNVLSIIYPDSSQEFLDKEIEDIHSAVSEDAKGSYAKLIQPPYLKPFLIV
ncbi:4666_t:CDS:2, partial [Racocetra fulgida]